MKGVDTNWGSFFSKLQLHSIWKKKEVSGNNNNREKDVTPDFEKSKKEKCNRHVPKLFTKIQLLRKKKEKNRA